jgi:cytochrome c oxidase cbb3-type subunit 4
MDTYSLLHLLADTWGVAAMLLVLVAVWLWAWRPGSRPLHDDAAQVPFRNERLNDETPGE